MNRLGHMSFEFEIVFFYRSLTCLNLGQCKIYNQDKRKSQSDGFHITTCASSNLISANDIKQFINSFGVPNCSSQIQMMEISSCSSSLQDLNAITQTSVFIFVVCEIVCNQMNCYVDAVVSLISTFNL